MANGGKLITPFVPRTPKDEKGPAPKVRRLVEIKADSFEHMIPGMIGSVNYGSGRRAFNPSETIAGKTGTCIEQGVWIGLFTSYAPLKNPRLAVVVIGRGADGRNHFPVSVAGGIYRDLGVRFGATTMEQIATKRNSQLQRDLAAPKDSIAVTETTSLASDTEDSEEADDDSLTNGARKIETPKTIWGDPRRPADSKVKRVLLPVSNQTEDTAKPAKTSSQTAPKPAQRARRVAGN